MHPPALLNPPREPAAPAGARLLLLSWHFPPGQGAGALRWQKLAAHAAERGWGVDVVTAHPDALPSADPSRLGDLPPGTRVFGVRPPEHPLRDSVDAVRARLARIRAGRGGEGRAADDGRASAASAGRTESAASATPADLAASIAACSESAASILAAASFPSAPSDGWMEITESAASARSVEAVGSAESAASTESAESAAWTESARSAASTESASSAESARSARSAASTESASSAESARSARSAASTETAESATSAASAESAASAASADPDAELAWRRDLRWSVSPAGLARAYRAWRAFADEDGWARAAADAGRAILDPALHRAVVTCGPPHMVHGAGARLARASGLPLVMDMRDPWSLAPATLRATGSPLWYALAERHERAAVDAAALVVANTAAAADALRAAYPWAADRILAVMNGCDDEPLPPRREEGRFVVAYAGSIYIDRDPRALFRAAARVIRETGMGPERFGMEFVGHAASFGGAPLRALAQAEGIGAYVAVHPRRPRAEALRMLAGASVLLSLPQGVDMSIPSKLFEYMQFPAWVLAMAVPGGATERLLRGTGADVVAPGDEDGLARALRTRLAQWSAGERPRPLNADGRFSRRRQAEILFAALEARTGAPGALRRGRAA